MARQKDTVARWEKRDGLAQAAVNKTKYVSAWVAENVVGGALRQRGLLRSESREGLTGVEAAAIGERMRMLCNQEMERALVVVEEAIRLELEDAIALVDSRRNVFEEIAAESGEGE